MARISNRILSLALALSVGLAATAFAAPEAFPGAQGFGADALGGRTGSIYVVTNLNDSGAGSFRDAVSASNRVIVFAVSGQITLASAISAKSNLTILGQTAPGQGITLQGHELSFDSQSNDIVQYIRAREGAEDTSAKASINLGSTTNFILDHVSAEYSQYDNIDAVGSNGVANLTVQNSMLADPIHAQYFNMHTEGTNVTYLANLWANSGGRNPLAKSNSQFVNNAVYNYGYAYTTGNSAGVFNYDILNNYFITGANTNTASDTWYQLDSNQSAYASGNLLDSNKDGVLNGSASAPGGLNILSAEYFSSTKNLPTLTAAQAYAFTVAHAGSMFNNGNGTFGRDEVDTQIVSQVQSLGTAGSRYNAEKDTGNSNNGWGADVIGASPANTLDTVPFAWLTSHGLSTTNAADLLKKNALGYAMIEQYASEVADQYATQTWTNSSGAWVSGAWSSTAPGSYDHAYVVGNGASNGAATISGSDNATAFSLNIGGNGPAAGESLTVSGGSLNVQSNIILGDQNNASLNISNGTVFAYNVQLGNTVRDVNGNIIANYNGNLTLSGGTLAVQQIVYGVGNYNAWTSGGTFTWSGGTLQAIGNLAISVPAAISNNVTLDTNSFSGTISSVLSGTGNLTKISAGTLTLSANNTYSGNTTISAGAIRASTNSAFGTGTINVIAANGLVLSTGVTIPNSINAAAGASEFEDVPDASATATLSGNVNAGGSNQYRLGVSGSNAILRMTGASTATNTTIITRGIITFASTGSLINNSQAVTIGRSNSTSTVRLTVQDNALVQGNGILLGGLNGSSDDISTIVTTANNGTLSAGTGAFNLNNSNTTGTVTLNANDSSTLKAGSFTTGGTTQGQTTLSFNGGTILATAGDTATPFFPALGPAGKPLLATLQASGMTINDGGFNITVAQPFGGSGGLTKTGAGSLTISGANTFAGPVAVNAGRLTFSPTASLTSGNITVANGATLAIAAGGNLPNTANVSANGTVSMGASDTFAALTLGGTSNNWTGTVDLAGNKLVIKPAAGRATVLATLQNQAAFGATNSAGITSSTLPAGFGIAVIDNAALATPFTTFGGQSVDSNSLLIAPELLGDTNADGHVDLSDLSTVLNNFGATTSAWTSGNFDNAATIDLTDLSDVLNNFGASNPNASALPIATPEPASLTLLVPVALLLRTRRIASRFTR